MSGWAAFLWGALGAASLLVGYVLAKPIGSSRRAIGLLMGFGAGTLISAIGFQLVPEASFEHGWGVGIAFGAGALTYYIADRIVDGQGGNDRKKLAGHDEAGAPWAMVIGALLDGVPESFVLGTSLALGGAIDAAFLTAVFVSNIPEGVGGTLSLRAAGAGNRRIVLAWTLITLASAVVAVAGFQLAHSLPHEGIWAEAFAGGAMLTMLSDSMIPEAFRYGGRAVGLVTVLGYLVAAVLAVAQ